MGHPQSLLARAGRLSWVGALAVAVGVSGCSYFKGSPPPRGGSGATAAAAPPKGQGYYKVGNPYQINGVWYYPKEDPSYDETGIASWYGPGFHGKATANGESYDMNDLTAAHKTLPMPVFVRVTNLENGRSIVVRVNDRGPYANGRVIDMSRRGAQLLGFDQKGTAKVRVQYIGPALDTSTLTAQADAEPPQVTAAPRAAIQAETLPAPGAPPQPSKPRIKLPGSTSVAEATNPATARAPAKNQTPPADGDAGVLEPALPAPADYTAQRVTQQPTKATNIFVQVGAFTVYDNANRLSARVARYGKSKVTSTVVNGTDFYRVRIGPIDSVDNADQLLNQIIASGETQAHIVVE